MITANTIPDDATCSGCGGTAEVRLFFAVLDDDLDLCRPCCGELAGVAQQASDEVTNERTRPTGTA